MATNNFGVNSLATLVAIRGAEAAAFLTVGARKYFKDQLIGKRNGQSYRFVIRDTGKVVDGLVTDRNNGDIKNIVEREVTLTLKPKHIQIETNAIEQVTDVDWDKEIAEPNARKLMNKVVKDVIDQDFGKAGTVFAGRGFTPMAQAGAHLMSVTDEKLYGFCDPNVEAILTSNGQAFTPVGAPDLYSKGLLGDFHQVEYRAQRFLPNVTVSDALASATLSVTNYTTASSGSLASGNYDEWGVITLSGVSNGMSIPKGLPVYIDGIMACDTVGDPTSQEHAFIVKETVAATGTSVTAKVAKVDNSVNSTRDIAKADGSDVSAISGNASTIDAGKYYMGIVRANGAFEFETLDKLPAEGADYEKQTVEGVTVHQNKLVDIDTMENNTRWDVVTLAGVVEPRAVSYFYIK